MKLPLYPLAIVASLVLTGCGAGGTSTSAGDPLANNDSNSNSPLNFGMPRSLQQSDDSEGEKDNDDASDETNDNTETAGDVTRETHSEMAQVISEQDSYEVPMSALFIEADMLHERLEFTQYQLSDLEGVWEQIVSNCSAIADGETCSIPAGTLTTDNNDDDEEAEYWDASVYLAGRDIEYVRKPDASYDHAISFSETFEETDKVSEEYRWNEDQSRILSKMDGEWQYDGMSGTFNSSFVYAETEKGSEITFIEESKDDESEHKLSMQLRELGGEKNDIEAQTQSSWTYGDETGTTTSNVVANDDGGRLGSTSTFALADGTNEKFHSRHTFNDKGEVTSAEYCEEAEGIDCTKAENWEKVSESELNYAAEISEGNFMEGDLEYIDFAEEAVGNEEPIDFFEMTDEEFEAMSAQFTQAEEGFDGDFMEPEFGAANVASEIDWDNADFSEGTFFVLSEEEMDEDFFNTCQEMGMDESDCEFGEVLTLEGTEHSIENVTDALESVCEAMGISKEDCPIER